MPIHTSFILNDNLVMVLWRSSDSMSKEGRPWHTGIKEDGYLILSTIDIGKVESRLLTIVNEGPTEENDCQ